MVEELGPKRAVVDRLEAYHSAETVRAGVDLGVDLWRVVREGAVQKSCVAAPDRSLQEADAVTDLHRGCRNVGRDADRVTMAQTCVGEPTKGVGGWLQRGYQRGCPC